MSGTMEETLLQIHDLFWNDNFIYYIIFIASLTLLYARKDKWEKGYILFFPYSISLILVIYNPIFVKYSFKYFFNIAEYMRMWMLLPCFLIIAYVVTEMIGDMTRWKRVISCILCIIIFVLAGNNVKQAGYYIDQGNKYKINTISIEIADAIMEDSDGKEVSLLAQGHETQYDEGGSVYWGIRQYSAYISLRQDYLNEEIFQTDFDFDAFKNNLYEQEEKNEFDYLLVYNDTKILEMLKECNYDVIGEYGNYVLLKPPVIE